MQLILLSSCLLLYIFGPSAYRSHKLYRHLDKQKSNLTDDQIHQFIQILRRSIPRKPTMQNLPFRSFPKRKVMSYFSRSHKEQYFRDYSEAVCLFLMLPKAIHVMFMDNLNVPGIYRLNDGLHSIQIKPGMANNSVYKAILAHEIAHYYLYSHNIVLPDTQNNEYLTEIAAVYLGFGFLMLEGYGMFKNNNTYEMVGYISQSTIKRAIIATAKSRKQQPYHIFNQFGILDKLWARKQLSDLMAEYNRAKSEKHPQ
jgi:hypothetical protein